MVMLIKTVVKASSIEGVGLFADEDIEAGTIVWRYLEPIDQRYYPQQVEEMQEFVKEHMNRYAYLHSLTNRYVVCGDNARFINHFHQPNMGAHYPEGLDEGENIAMRDIARGEELTIDYSTFDLASDATHFRPR